MIYLDGYNIMHRLPQLHQLLRRGGVEQARERFLLMLQGLRLPTEWGQLEVVFDGEGDKSTSSRQRGVAIRFSSRRQSADQLIRDLLAAREQQHNLVVSSDREVQSYARRHGATAVPINWLLERIERRQAIPEPGEKPEGISRREVDEYLRLFGEEDSPSE
ncbi:MAG: NYN domain-containing protein [Candidatus Delongbacteria bacterium]|nr:NYN domain-containing protein [Candidatus Delongbacteria bacterium]